MTDTVWVEVPTAWLRQTAGLTWLSEGGRTLGPVKVAEGPSLLTQLRGWVLEEPGDWTTTRARQRFGVARPITIERARHLLNQLADDGILIRHGKRGHTWTRPQNGKGS